MIGYIQVILTHNICNLSMAFQVVEHRVRSGGREQRSMSCLPPARGRRSTKLSQWSSSSCCTFLKALFGRMCPTDQWANSWWARHWNVNKKKHKVFLLNVTFEVQNPLRMTLACVTVFCFNPQSYGHLVHAVFCVTMPPAVRPTLLRQMDMESITCAQIWVRKTSCPSPCRPGEGSQGLQ